MAHRTLRGDAPLRRLAITLVVLVGFVSLVGALNWRRGAFESGLGSYDDEPSHAVTG